MKAGLALLMVFYCCAAHAEGGLLRGTGIDSCGKFIAESAGRPIAKSQTWVTPQKTYYDKYYAYSEWIQGYLTALSVLTDVHSLDAVDYPGVDLWMRKWCDKHPTQKIYDALNALIAEKESKLKK